MEYHTLALFCTFVGIVTVAVGLALYLTSRPVAYHRQSQAESQNSQ